MIITLVISPEIVDFFNLRLEFKKKMVCFPLFVVRSEAIGLFCFDYIEIKQNFIEI